MRAVLSINKSIVKTFFVFSVYCLVGDGESAEGSIWEALHFASHYKLDNLCVIFDINRLGQSEATSIQHDMEVYRKRLESFGFNTLVVDGHDVDELTKVSTCDFHFKSVFLIVEKIKQNYTRKWRILVLESRILVLEFKFMGILFIYFKKEI